MSGGGGEERFFEERRPAEMELVGSWGAEEDDTLIVSDYEGDNVSEDGPAVEPLGSGSPVVADEVQRDTLPFAERAGLHRKPVWIGLAGLAVLLLYAGGSLNKSAAEKKEAAADNTSEIVSEVEQAEAGQYPGVEDPSWAGVPKEEPRPEPALAPAPQALGEDGGGFVPLGADVVAGTYGATATGDPPVAGAPGAAEAGPVQPAPDDPQVIRRKLYEEALMAGVRRKREDQSPRYGEAQQPVAPVAPGAQEGARDPDDLSPEVRAGAEADRGAAEAEMARLRAMPPVSHVSAPGGSRFQFASYGATQGRVVRAGTIISAALVFQVISDVPGVVKAQVARDVYDAQMRMVLIPAGSFLLGRQQSGEVRIGEDRLVVAWTALQLPNKTVVLPTVPGSDQLGAAGLPARVDRRAREVFQAAALLSVLSAGVERISPATPGGFGSAPSTPAQPLLDAARGYIEPRVKLAPKLTIPAATQFTLVLPIDVDLDAPPPPPVPVGAAPVLT